MKRIFCASALAAAMVFTFGISNAQTGAAAGASPAPGMDHVDHMNHMDHMDHGHGMGSMHNGACKADREKFCANMKMGEGMMKCMKEHEAELSPECKSMMEEHKKMMQEHMAACQPDVEKLCKDVKPGEGNIIKCLKQNEAKLSPACKEAMPKHMKGKKAK